MASNNIKRGAFLPRGDLTNKSPEDDENDNNSSSEHSGGIGGGSLKVNANHHHTNKPPHPPMNKHNQKQQYLPVKSSGYGRPNSSSSTASSSSSSRPSTPSNRHRPTTTHHPHNSYTALSSPANNSTHSTTSSRLRHGDGTLVQNVIGRSVGKFKKNRAAQIMNGNHTASSRIGGMRSRSPGQLGRLRSPSPAAIARSERGYNHGSAIKGSSRSRTPSPMVKRPLSRQNNAEGIMNMNGSGMKMKKQWVKNNNSEHGKMAVVGGSGSSSIQHHSPSPSLMGSSIYNNLINQFTKKEEKGEEEDGRSRQYYKDYSAIDADPTPVKEARRLSSIFYNRASGGNNGHQAASCTTMGMGVLLEDPASPVARTNMMIGGNGKEIEAPLSYSKVVKKGLLASSTKQAAAGAGANNGVSSPLSAMKLFQPSDTSSNTTTMSTSASSSLFDEFNNNNNNHDPNSSSQITTLSTQLFSRSSGIDTPNIQHLLSNSYKQKDKQQQQSSISSTGVVPQWELRKRLQRNEEDLAVIRTALQDLLRGKESFVLGAIQIEQGLRDKLMQAKVLYEQMVEEKCTLNSQRDDDQNELLRLKQEVQEYKTKCEALTCDNDKIQSQLDACQQSSQDHATAHAALESKLQRVTNEKDEAISQIAQLKVQKETAVKDVERIVRGEMQEKLSKSQQEKEALVREMKVRRGWEEEVCKLMNVNVAFVNFSVQEEKAVIDGADHDDHQVLPSFMEAIQQRVREYQNDIKTRDELEKSLESCMMELDKAEADYQGALEAAAVKDRDMSELMKSIGDIQRSGQEREQEVANQRKTAEDRAAAAESQVAECREQLLALGYEKKSLEEALETAKATFAAQKSTIDNLQKEIANSKIETVQHDSQLQLERDLRAKAEEKEADERAERIALSAQLNAQVQEHAQSEKQLRDSMESMEKNLSEQIRVKEEESKMKDAELTKCKEMITALEANQQSLKSALSDQKSMLETSKEEEIGRLRGEIANLESRLKSEVEKLESAGVVSEAKVHELEEIIRKGKEERKRMHNIIQELRGNVRVFARIRPFLPSDGKTGDEDGAVPSICPEGELQVTVAKPHDPSQRHRFQFDRVFAPSAGQEAVFDEVSEFVQSSLDGYQVCLFSYGQTGSGKTFTMQGAGNGVMRGLIPRSIEQIAAHKTNLEKDGWTFTMEISFLEIYNETLKDLLRENPDVESKHEIKVGSDGRRTVTNLTVKSIDPSDREAVEAVLTLAAKRRSTAATDMNATSSRSHSVFTLNMTAKHEEQNRVVRGTLNLIDLAGSERLDRSNARGQQAKEAVAINKSLSSLADVFTAIGQKQSHVPFRNSRLTYLLQPALSGEGKTCMLVNISPTEDCLQETLCSLRFASKVNKCELGKAKRTIEEAKCDGASKRNATSSKGSVATSRNVKRRHH